MYRSLSPLTAGVILSASVAAMAPMHAARAAAETVLYNFKGIYASGPSGLALAPTGLLYSVYYGGGGPASIFTISKTGQKKTIYVFPVNQTNLVDSLPVFDNSGNVFGTSLGGNYGFIYKLSPAKVETVLYAFKGGNDGADPGTLISDGSGNFYGATAFGGGSGGPNGYGAGTIFKIAPSGAYTVLYRFGAAPVDGVTPTDPLIAPNGTIYGTTYGGGTGNCVTYKRVPGCGTVYSLSPTGTKSTLYNFQANRGDGVFPGTLVIDGSGNLFGTTSAGGTSGFGTVFEITPAGKETVLYSFAGGADGYSPAGPLMIDAAGVLYGVTGYDDGTGNAGTVFSLTPAGVHTVLLRFGPNDIAHDARGIQPNASLYLDASGTLFGTTSLGGKNNNGVMFKVTP